MKKEIHIILLSLLIPIISFAQNEENVFIYLKNKVKTVKFSKREKISYEYKEGVIIERENFSNKVERHYHYKEVGKLDSIVYFEIYDDTIYTLKKIYDYNDSAKLVKTRYDESPQNKIINIDSIVYDYRNLVDSILWFSNRRETVFGTERTDSVTLYASSKFLYDENSRLIRKKNSHPFGVAEIAYFYDKKGNITKTIEHLRRARGGCLAGEDKRYSINFFSYSETGLLIKEISINYLVQPNGEKKENNRVEFRKKYTFY